MKIHKGKKDGQDYYFIQQGTSLCMRQIRPDTAGDDPLLDWEQMIVDLCEHSLKKEVQAMRIIKKLRGENAAMSSAIKISRERGNE